MPSEKVDIMYDGKPLTVTIKELSYFAYTEIIDAVGEVVKDAAGKPMDISITKTGKLGRMLIEAACEPTVDTKKISANDGAKLMDAVLKVNPIDDASFRK